MTAGALGHREAPKGASRSGEAAATVSPKLRGFTAIGSVAGALLALVAFLAVPGPSSTAAEFALFLGRFHPLLVHLPIGALVLVVLLETASALPPFRGKMDGALALALPVASLFGGVAFLFGLLLAHGGGYADGPIAWHRGLTLGALGVLALAGVAFSFSLEASQGAGAVPRIVYRLLLLATMGVLTVGAHFGGNLSRGEAYLTEYAPAFVKKMLGEKPREKKSPVAVEPGADRKVFQDVVAPILARTCVECHGERSAKAKLRVDSLEAILKGGESGPAALARDGARSPLYARMVLPTSDDEHMPPEGHPAPTEAERELIRWWIDRGATDTLVVADALPPTGARELLESASGGTDSPAPSSSPSSAPSASAAPTSSDSAAPEASSSPPGTSTSPPAPTANGLVYRDAVAPILAARCESCHGGAKQKGKLRVDSIAAMTSGGVSGAAITPGNGSGSLLVSRMTLPLMADEHMPPPKLAQPTQNEIDLVAWWIDHGADATTPTSALPAKFLGTKPTPTPIPVPSTVPSTHPSTNPSTHPSTSGSSSAPPLSSSGNSTDPPVALPNTLRWESDVVVPLFVARCGPCHVGESPVSTFGVDTGAILHKGGYSGVPVIAGDPGKSLVMSRLVAPLSDGDHMPPDGSEQLTPDQIELVRQWIVAGADDREFAAASLSLGQQRAVAMFLPEPVHTPDPSTSSSSSSTGSGSSTSSGPDGASSTGGGEVPPVHGSGCASCSFEASSEDTALAVACSLAFVLVLTSRRKPKR
ncbi:MAG: c-type cytochrome domain-containing protein [Polyangiaceae bacterium]